MAQHPSTLGHEVELPQQFGRTIDQAVAVCRKCGATWMAYYTRKGLEFKPQDKKARRRCNG